ncbi:ribosomal protein S18 acetylase RimI-like enzyme [Bacillus horti]|uniref:Ribosomal protein S18 acetylase RimI-like enzyme n=1 Tax=Caldalkalibacillus horti TaxID=77523 RepID=A0ABT9VYM9_9BACI|nr:ribosomal protein S18 acetylase RimI-like enzyme [Bacillus horti]
MGYLWFAIKEEEAERPYAFLYEIFLLPEARGQGIGEAAIELMKKEAKAQGVDKIWLHVFGHNESAYRFYKRLGFTVTDYTMSIQTDI